MDRTHSRSLESVGKLADVRDGWLSVAVLAGWLAMVAGFLAALAQAVWR